MRRRSRQAYAHGVGLPHTHPHAFEGAEVLRKVGRHVRYHPRRQKTAPPPVPPAAKRAGEASKDDGRGTTDVKRAGVARGGDGRDLR